MIKKGENVMPDVNTVRNFLLMGSAIFLSMTIFLCLMRAALGPRFSDRIIAKLALRISISRTTP